MNFFSNITTQKNSVNSSLATIKGVNNSKQINETINKNNKKCKVRFSYQQPIENPKKLQRNSSYKQSSTNFKLNFQQIKNHCFNHQNKLATHSVFQNSQDPLYYCQRCAILIASKGFNINSLSIQQNKENNINFNRRNSHITTREGIFVIEEKQNNKPLNRAQRNMKNADPRKEKQYHGQRVFLSNEIIYELQSCWKGLKQSREKGLNEIDISINILNQGIDSLQDYYYTLHEYIQKQKNIQIKEILSKKQLLEQLRTQTSQFYIKEFLAVKQLKQTLIKFGQCQLQQYRKLLNKKNQFNINSETILIDFKRNNELKANNVHFVGQQIVNFISQSNFAANCSSQKLAQQNKRNSISYHDHRPLTCLQKPQVSQHKNRNDSSFKRISNLNLVESSEYNDCYEEQKYYQKHEKFNNCQINENKNKKPFDQVKNIESSVRSLQLSFDNSQNEDDEKQKVSQQKEESNNFTLNQYINNRSQSYANHRGEQSYTNLLLTSTQI